MLDQILSCLIFFFIVFACYGMPFGIFYEVCVSYLEVHKKMVLFESYRKFSHMIDAKFHACATDEELEDSERTCIVCIDGLLLSEKLKKYKDMVMCFINIV